MLTMLLATAGVDAADPNERSHFHRQYHGAYYPGMYYSRAYLQDFQLQPGETPLVFRLRPFQHYGRYAYGQPIEPGLTRGTVESTRFPYRYAWDFEPTPRTQPVVYDACNDPAARRYESLAAPSESLPVPNEPAELPPTEELGR
jgi:hypothetical protein